MTVLITGAASRLGQQIVAALDTAVQLRLLDTVRNGQSNGRIEWIEGSLTDQDTVRRAVRDVDALIHTGEPPADLPEDAPEREEALMDLATRGTHMLYTAAVEAGVGKIIYAGTLEIFRDYSDTVCVSEYHEPLPNTDPATLCRYMGELISREFARDHTITVTGLRLGVLVLEEQVAGVPQDLMWVDLRDAAQAFCVALKREESASVQWAERWAIYHISAPIKNPKFLIRSAFGIGYAPEHDFGCGELS